MFLCVFNKNKHPCVLAEPKFYNLKYTLTLLYHLLTRVQAQCNHTYLLNMEAILVGWLEDVGRFWSDGIGRNKIWIQRVFSLLGVCLCRGIIFSKAEKNFWEANALVLHSFKTTCMLLVSHPLYAALQTKLWFSCCKMNFAPVSWDRGNTHEKLVCNGIFVPLFRMQWGWGERGWLELNL